MKKRCLITIITLLLSACSHTFNGMGEDMQEMGKAVSGASGGSKQDAPHQPVNTTDPNTRY